MIEFRKLIWCTFTRSLYDETEDCDALIRKCIDLIKNCDDIEVTVGFYYIELQTKSTHIKLWNANKWYAWLCRGSVNGRSFDHSMPKKSTAYELKQLLQSLGHNLFPSEPKAIRIDDIGC